VRTSSCAFGPYFRRELDFFFEDPDDRFDREFALREDDERLELLFFLLLDFLLADFRPDDFFDDDLRPLFFAAISFLP
jgi:hypothetical protein